MVRVAMGSGPAFCIQMLGMRGGLSSNNVGLGDAELGSYLKPIKS
jgi:hypothetical protein